MHLQYNCHLPIHLLHWCRPTSAHSHLHFSRSSLCSYCCSLGQVHSRLKMYQASLSRFNVHICNQQSSSRMSVEADFVMLSDQSIDSCSTSDVLTHFSASLHKQKIVWGIICLQFFFSVTCLIGTMPLYPLYEISQSGFLLVQAMMHGKSSYSAIQFFEVQHRTSCIILNVNLERNRCI